jgi:hypothetical protein
MVQRFDPPSSAWRRAAALLLFVAILAATVLLLWHAHTLPGGKLLLGAIGIALGLTVLGWLGNGAGGLPAAAGVARSPVA